MMQGQKDIKLKQYGQCTYEVTLSHVLATIIAVDQQ